MRSLVAFSEYWKPSSHRLAGFDPVVTIEDRSASLQNAGTGNLLIGAYRSVVIDVDAADVRHAAVRRQ